MYVYWQNTQTIHNIFMYTIQFLGIPCYNNHGGVCMIKYKINVLQALKSKGYSTYKMRNEKILNEAQIQQLRDNKLLAQDALNKVCTLLDCQPGDLLEYIPDGTETDHK